MVFFTCNVCGESIKKVQVEKHLGVCRSSKCLSCIDCGKDFWGDEYKTHLKCISEDQKYGGKGFEAKSNKGEVKQQQWIQKIHEAMKKPGLSPKLKDILNQISTYDNIPRKKAKFQNWMKNSLKIHDPTTQENVWEIFSEAHSNINTNPQAKQLQEVVKQPKENDYAPAEQSKMTLENGEKKKSKRERKEERQKNKKKEKKKINGKNEEDDAQMKKGKKRAKEMEETADAEPEEITENDGAEIKKKKKKNRKGSKGDLEVNGNGPDFEIAELEQIRRNIKKRKHRPSEGEPEAKQKKIENIEEARNEDATESAAKGKFNWKGTMKAVLKQAPDNEISLKKLRKKVLAQYYSVATEHHKSEEDLLVIFNKKIRCNPKFKVLKEKVKLMN